ncbi:MAG: dual specificity protein phosphatase family protein, partial [Candidatus Omnitrophica bacterium]|nr:dual specificity protein phosphatase family protein [Candidatus Omnitrophota bacterium]
SKPQGITAILNVAAEKDLVEPYGLYYKIPLQDFVPISPDDMRRAIHWIQDQIPHHTILVFCNAGVGRSSSVVIGYLVSTGLGFGEAVEFVAKRKPNMSILPFLIETIDQALR